MQTKLFMLLFVFFHCGLGFSEPDCGKLLKSLYQSALTARTLNLKKAQELAEEFVSRPIASEVLADPGVEMALEHSLGSGDSQLVPEAIEEALLARGMSPGQAKKAAQGWTRAMQESKILP
jgi:hypothetical protein